MSVCHRMQLVMDNEGTDSEAPAFSEGTDMERPKWRNKRDYMLTVIGYCVSLANIWRFPYMCNRNGGGAFLIPFVLFLVLCGLPLFFLEVALGQFSGKCALHIWSLCPLMKGLGIGMSLLSALTCSYFTIVLAWSLYYLARSCAAVLPWTTCGNWWNTELCVESMSSLHANMSTMGNTTCMDTVWNKSSAWNGSDVMPCSGNLENLQGPSGSGRMWRNATFAHSAAEEFWQYNTLGISERLEDVGHIQWHLALSLFISWIVIFFCVVRGIQTVGRVVYVTATMPYILLVCLLIQGLLLPGGKDGVLVYITPDFHRLADVQVWLEACLQVFYSLGPAWGGLITMASYNRFHNNCMRDAIIATFVSEGTSMFGGLVVFSVLGFLAQNAGVTVSEAVSSGPGLGYVSYPEALSHLPVPQMWSFLFFSMLIFLALDSIFSMIETVISAITDEYPVLRKRRALLTFGYCLLSYIFGLLMTTEGGMYIFQLIDWYLSFIFLLKAAFLECVVLCWIYGFDRFSADIEMMIGRKPPFFFKITWCYITPALLLTAFISILVRYQPPTYGKYKYPAYAASVGWCLAAIPVVPFVVMAIKALKEAKGNPLQGEVYIFQLIDWYLSFIFLLKAAFLECVVLCWIYGFDRFSADIVMMIGRKPPFFFKVTWCYITPALLLTAFISILVRYQPPTYGKYKYPVYAASIGWCLAAIPAVPFVVMAIKALKEAKGNPLQVNLVPVP